MCFISVLVSRLMMSNTRIKVIGVGGSGSNAISRMMKRKIRGVELIAMNTDVQDLKKTSAHLKLWIGKKLTQGLGTGMDPKQGQRAALEQKDEISEVLKGSDMVFVTYGAGGGTGTGAGPVIAEISKDIGALTVAVVTTPFSFEGGFRREIAKAGIETLKEKVDALISIPNDNLQLVLDPDISLIEAFWACDEVLYQAVRGISDLIVLPGIVNVGFADILSIMKNSGKALFGIGKAKGDNRAQEAARRAINSPLLDISIEQAKGVLFNVSGGPDISLYEIDTAAKFITEKASPRAKVIFGAVQDEKLPKGEIKVIVIATKFAP